METEKHKPVKRTSPRATGGDSREALLEAAKFVFAQKGYEGATVKDLADRANVNPSLISYHFGGKEALYRSCLESFGMERVEMAERILSAPKNRDEFHLRLRLFAEEWIMIHARDRDVCKMIYRGMENLNSISASVFKDVFYRIFVSLHQFLSAAQLRGIVRSDLQMEMTTTLMFGSLVHTMRDHELAEFLGKPTIDHPPYRTLVIEHWTNCFTSGIFSNTNEYKVETVKDALPKENNPNETNDLRSETKNEGSENANI